MVRLAHYKVQIYAHFLEYAIEHNDILEANLFTKLWNSKSPSIQYKMHIYLKGKDDVSSLLFLKKAANKNNRYLLKLINVLLATDEFDEAKKLIVLNIHRIGILPKLLNLYSRVTTQNPEIYTEAAVALSRLIKTSTKIKKKLYDDNTSIRHCGTTANRSNRGSGETTNGTLDFSGAN